MPRGQKQGGRQNQDRNYRPGGARSAPAGYRGRVQSQRRPPSRRRMPIRNANGGGSGTNTLCFILVGVLSVLGLITVGATAWRLHYGSWSPGGAEEEDGAAKLTRSKSKRRVPDPVQPKAPDAGPAGGGGGVAQEHVAVTAQFPNATPKGVPTALFAFFGRQNKNVAKYVKGMKNQNKFKYDGAPPDHMLLLFPKKATIPNGPTLRTALNPKALGEGKKALRGNDIDYWIKGIEEAVRMLKDEKKTVPKSDKTIIVQFIKDMMGYELLQRFPSTGTDEEKRFFRAFGQLRKATGEFASLNNKSIKRAKAADTANAADAVKKAADDKAANDAKAAQKVKDDTFPDISPLHPDMENVFIWMEIQHGDLHRIVDRMKAKGDSFTKSSMFWIGLFFPGDFGLTAENLNVILDPKALVVDPSTYDRESDIQSWLYGMEFIVNAIGKKLPVFTDEEQAIVARFKERFDVMNVADINDGPHKDAFVKTMAKIR